MLRRIIPIIIVVALCLSGCSSDVRKIVDPSKITYADSYEFEKLTFEGIEEVECNFTVEIEDYAKQSSGVKLKASQKGYSGEGYADISDNSAFKMVVDIPSNQYYKLTVRHTAGGHKENAILFNGLQVMWLVSEAGDWQETTIDGIYLEKGENVVTLGSGWSWFSLDSITIENGSPISDDVYSGVTETLSNPYANLKTQNIYQYLKAVYGKRTLAGQCTDYGHNTETDALYLGTGKYPAVRTFDFIFDSMSYCHGKPRAEDVDLAIQWSDDGGLVVYDWHWYAPYDECAFYSDETTFSLAKAVTDVDIAHLSLDEVKQLYLDDKISVETYKIVEDIDNISSLMQRMEDENVTVMWRPLHEASGGWFWWGRDGAEPYKWLWKLLYERMTDYHELDNLIWVWNGQDEAWYPGDEYCDIISMDIYNSAHDYGTSPGTLTDMIGWVDGEKLVTMSECATMPNPDLIIRDNAYWLWFAVWNWDYIVVNGTTELSDAYTEIYMMDKVYNSEVIITRDELPDFD